MKLLEHLSKVKKIVYAVKHIIHMTKLKTNLLLETLVCKKMEVQAVEVSKLIVIIDSILS